MHRTSRPSPPRPVSQLAATLVRGSASRQTRGIAVLLSAAGDGRIVVGNAVDYPDSAVEVLLMHSIGAGGAGDARCQPESGTAQCMLLGLGGLAGDAGADNMVVFMDQAAPVRKTEQAQARVLVVS